MNYIEIKSRLGVGDTIISCSSRKEALEFLTKLDEMGCTWRGGQKMLDYKVTEKVCERYFYIDKNSKVTRGTLTNTIGAFKYDSEVINRAIIWQELLVPQYKLKNVIAMLDNDPTKVFKRTDDGFTLRVRNGRLLWSSDADPITFQDKWVEIDNPLENFLATYKNYLKGFDLLCVRRDGTRKIYKTTADLEWNDFLVQDIMEGLWAIMS